MKKLNRNPEPTKLWIQKHYRKWTSKDPNKLLETCTLEKTKGKIDPPCVDDFTKKCYCNICRPDYWS